MVTIKEVLRMCRYYCELLQTGITNVNGLMETKVNSLLAQCRNENIKVVLVKTKYKRYIKRVFK